MEKWHASVQSRVNGAGITDAAFSSPHICNLNITDPILNLLWHKFISMLKCHRQSLAKSNSLEDPKDRIFRGKTDWQNNQHGSYYHHAINKGQRYINTLVLNNCSLCDKHWRYSAQLKTHVAIALENSHDEALKLQTSLSVFAYNPEDSLEVQEHSSD